MKANDFENIACPIADVLSALNDKWTGLILRDIFFGNNRYNQLSENSNITHATLSNRLKLLENNGMVEKKLYQTRPERYEYHLTERGQDLAWLMLALAKVGEKWHLSAWQKPPFVVHNRHTGNTVRLAILDNKTGQEIELGDLALVKNS